MSSSSTAPRLKQFRLVPPTPISSISFSGHNIPLCSLFLTWGSNLIPSSLWKSCQSHLQNFLLLPCNIVKLLVVSETAEKWSQMLIRITRLLIRSLVLNQCHWTFIRGKLCSPHPGTSTWNFVNIWNKEMCFTNLSLSVMRDQNWAVWTRDTTVWW